MLTGMFLVVLREVDHYLFDLKSRDLGTCVRGEGSTTANPTSSRPNQIREIFPIFPIEFFEFRNSSKVSGS